MTKIKKVSAGIVIRDKVKNKILVGHATETPRWDIFKGGVDVGETLIQGAVRECQEEAGLTVDPASLVFLGEHPYSSEKRVAVFVLDTTVDQIDMGTLGCSTYLTKGDRRIQEIDGYQWIDISKESFTQHFGISMCRLLTNLLI